MPGRFSFSRSRGDSSDAARRGGAPGGRGDRGGGSRPGWGSGGSPAPAGLPRIDAAEFRSQVVEASATAPVVVDFVAPWCRPCIAMEPVLAELATRFSGDVTMLSVDIQENPGLAADLQILSIPLLAAYSGGEQVATLHGAKPKKAISSFIESVL